MRPRYYSNEYEAHPLIELPGRLSDSRDSHDHRFIPRRFGRIAALAAWIPHFDPGSSRHKGPRTRISRRRKMLYLQIGVASSVLVGNVIWTSWMIIKHGTNNGIGTITSGNCDVSYGLNSGLHALINVLSTLLLSASNFSMQLLVAPTRGEVNKAHRRNGWFNIGVSSIRNLRGVNPASAVVWILLVLSSTPIHLLWNAAIFNSTPTFPYLTYIATNDFSSKNTSWGNSHFDHVRLDTESWEQLDKEQCIDRYINPLNGGKDVVVVTKVSSSSNDDQTLLTTIDPSNPWYESGDWICASDALQPLVEDGGCTKEFMDPFLYNWTVKSGENGQRAAEVDYCLSEGVNQDSRCGVHFSAVIMIAICIMNFITLSSIIFVTARDRVKGHLVTTGDAIASFLESEDITTQQMCIGSRDFFAKSKAWSPQPMVFDTQGRRWFQVAGRLRWSITMGLCVITVGGMAALLVEALKSFKRDHRSTDLSSLRGTGLGAVNSQQLVNGPLNDTGFYGVMILANGFQLLLSCIYFMYNSILTSMLAAYEWSGYSGERTFLRVSDPKGGQRSSYFLSLPYKFGIPLVIVSGLLHWLASQSIFPVSAVPYSQDGVEMPSGSSYRLGFSPIGAILVFSLFLLMVIALPLLGFFGRFPGGRDAMPFASSCSAAISAACHKPIDDFDAHLLPVQWGVVSNSLEDNDGVGRCSFTTAKDVKRPRIGYAYA